MHIEWTIGDVIAKLRESKRLNQTQLAKKVGHNKATIVRVEAGDPNVSRKIYLKVAAALGTELVQLEIEAARLSGAPKETQSEAASPRTGATFPATGTELDRGERER